jgi:enterochelin esterase-like enzyme
MTGKSHRVQILSFALALGSASPVFAQTNALSPHGSIEHIKVHGRSLEGNLEGDSPDRDVSIYLPPSYNKGGNRRYPAVYLLHGLTDRDSQWFGLSKGTGPVKGHPEWQHFINVPQVVDGALLNGTAREMIIVMPNAYTAYQGSFYSNSITTGDWETYIANDLVSYIDGHYRTIAERGGRGLAGHSSGGYGAIRIGMKHPEVFSSIYILSPCCVSKDMMPEDGDAAIVRAEAVRSAADLGGADFVTRGLIALAASWSPNPSNPPLFFDFPSKDGHVQPAIAAKWTANSALALVDHYTENLRRLRAIAIDVGARDTGPRRDGVTIVGEAKALDQGLTAKGIGHTFEIYDGDHINRIAERFESKVLPFFSNNLLFREK